jgi:hypothetical protein
MLPPPANLAGNDHHCVLALVHHADDQFTSTQVVTDNLSRGERKAAHKNLKVVQFTGTLPAAGEPPAVMAIQINGVGRRLALSNLILAFTGYRGRVRVWVPELPMQGSLLENVEGARRIELGKDARAWATRHVEEILMNQDGDNPYDREWSKQRLDDVNALLESGEIFVGDARAGRITINNIALRPGTRGAIFLLFDRSKDVKPGTWFPIEVIQVDAKSQRVLGGLSARVEVVPRPRRVRPASPRPQMTRPEPLDIPELVETARPRRFT